MSRISRPSNKVTVYDPETGGHEAVTTDVDEMNRRAKKAAAAAKREQIEAAEEATAIKIVKSTKNK